MISIKAMIKVEVFHNSILKSCSYCVYDDSSLEGYIIDVGDVEPIISFITERKIDIKGVFLTHPHFDHVYGIMGFANIYPSTCFYCSAESLVGLKNEDVNMSYMYLENEFEMPQDKQFVIIDERSFVECFGKPIQIFPCPGHDSGCLSFIIENNIFTGDSYTPFAPVTYNWHRCNKELAIKSEASLFELIESRGLNVYPGHYQK